MTPVDGRVFCKREKRRVLMEIKGVFAVLEGLDGSGTTTQTGMLKDWFKQEGIRFGTCLATCEPTPGPAGSIARLALSHRITLDPYTLALLFAADRTDHLYKMGGSRHELGIEKLLKQGVHVVSDRYMLSSLAYQSLDVSMDWILQINEAAIRPDLTIFIDIEPQISQSRIARDRLQQELFEAAGVQERVQVQYEKAIALLTGMGHCIKRIDGNRPPADVHRDVVHELLPFLENSIRGGGPDA